MQKLIFKSNTLKQAVLLLGAIIVTLSACKKDDPPVAANQIQFESSKIGFSADDSKVEVHLEFSRAADAAGIVELQLKENGVAYGDQYETDPAVSAGVIRIPFEQGAQEAVFTVTKKAGVHLDGDESLGFAISSVGSSLVLGTNDSLNVVFSAIVSDGSTMKLNGGEGGSAAENVVFVDLSANKQTAVKRMSWDLGFFNGDDFRVVLNNTLPDAMAVAIDKTDLSQVTAADTAGIVLTSTFTAADLAKVDDFGGDLSKTVISAISTDPAVNKVYILNRGEAAAHTDGKRDWMKIRIIQKEGGYQLQFAKIADATFKTVDIPKEDTHNFSYVTLDGGSQVNVEPAKNKWDFQWGVGAYYTGNEGSTIYYPFSDLVFINNRDGVQVAEVKTSAVKYDAFSATNLSGLTFSGERDAIGANWRATTGTAIGVYTDRFFIIKDPIGNYYKLRFNNFTSQDGDTRGYPNIEYALVKAAE